VEVSCPPYYITVGNISYPLFYSTIGGQTAQGHCPPGLLFIYFFSFFFFFSRFNIAPKGQAGNPTLFCDNTGTWGEIQNPCKPRNFFLFFIYSFDFVIFFFFKKKKNQNKIKVPEPVQNLTLTIKTSNSIGLQWQPGAQTLFYKISLSTDAINFFVVANGEGDNWPETNYIVEQLNYFTTYYLKVQAGNQAGYENQGAVIKVQTFLQSLFHYFFSFFFFLKNALDSNFI